MECIFASTTRELIFPQYCVYVDYCNIEHCFKGYNSPHSWLFTLLGIINNFDLETVTMMLLIMWFTSTICFSSRFVVLYCFSMCFLVHAYWQKIYGLSFPCFAILGIGRHVINLLLYKINNVKMGTILNIACHLTLNLLTASSKRGFISWTIFSNISQTWSKELKNIKWINTDNYNFNLYIL